MKCGTKIKIDSFEEQFLVDFSNYFENNNFSYFYSFLIIIISPIQVT